MTLWITRYTEGTTEAVHGLARWESPGGFSLLPYTEGTEPRQRGHRHILRGVRPPIPALPAHGGPATRRALVIPS